MILKWHSQPCPLLLSRSTAGKPRAPEKEGGGARTCLKPYLRQMMSLGRNSLVENKINGNWERLVLDPSSRNEAERHFERQRFTNETALCQNITLRA